MNVKSDYSNEKSDDLKLSELLQKVNEYSLKLMVIQNKSFDIGANSESYEDKFQSIEHKYNDVIKEIEELKSTFGNFDENQIISESEEQSLKDRLENEIEMQQKHKQQLIEDKLHLKEQIEITKQKIEELDERNSDSTNTITLFEKLFE
eukprot:TRINITY_DN3279_c1_g1_i1.p1 TRINITY_DN3279_c1_g1~~TRINITY_DN3279_c1_g1_i1.p1  ORF type:complete len:149 (+),score=54.52 TRINITY_DN3279_c1_g1_i1:45-491(+)